MGRSKDRLWTVLLLVTAVSEQRLEKINTTKNCNNDFSFSMLPPLRFIEFSWESVVVDIKLHI